MRRESRRSEWAMLAFAGTLLSAVLLIVVSSNLEPAEGSFELQEVGGSPDLDEQYLQAASSGEKGKEFVQRLQDMWFIEANGKHPKLAANAAGIVGQLMHATFPDDVVNNIDTSVDPCDDFYEYACGKWVKENKDKIKTYETRLAFAWNAASDRGRESEIEILKTDQGPAGIMYRSCMDTEKIEAAGAAPLKPWLDVIDGVHDMPSLVKAVVVFNKHNQDTLFTWWIETNPRDTSTRSLSLGQGSASLPDKTYYTEDTEEMKGHRAKMVEMMTHFFTLVGRPDPAAEARMVADLDKKVAFAEVDRDESRKDHGADVGWETVEALTPSWPWKVWLSELASCDAPPDGSPKACTGDHAEILTVGQADGKKLVLSNKPYFEALDKIIKETPLDAIKASMRWKLIRNSGPYLSAEYIDGLVELNKDLYGTSAKNPRDRKCYGTVSADASWAAAKLYTEKVFKRENRDAALAMLDKVRAQFRATLKVEDWMDESDRTAATHKLDEMFFQVGWPTDTEGKEDWPEQTTLLDGKLGDDLFANYMTSNRVAIEQDFIKLPEAPNRRSWGGSTPMDVNAFYGPNNNGLWIPAGILQAPFFDAEYPAARNFGAIGSVLGHEMSHGFDDNGREFDARGNLHDWWDDKTVTQFKERSGCIADVFDKYKIQGRAVNGKLTLGEDIADSGGLKFAYSALEAEQATPAEKRLFFTSFAQTWCSVTRAKAAKNSVLTDPHAPAKFRVIGGLTQFAPFAEAFQCPAGSPMAPTSRCHLW